VTLKSPFIDVGYEEDKEAGDVGSSLIMMESRYLSYSWVPRHTVNNEFKSLKVYKGL
jgi:hypothetical protein